MKKMQLISGLLSSILFTCNITIANIDTGHPDNFTTRNYTSYESNAKIGFVWSPFPTPAANVGGFSERKVPWVGLKMLCGSMASQCGAKIYMYSPKDPANKIFIGEGVMDMKTGEINPNRMVSNGFVVTSPAPATIEIRQEAAG